MIPSLPNFRPYLIPVPQSIPEPQVVDPAPTGAVAVADTLLLFTTDSPLTGLVLADMVGVVPTAVVLGVIGILKLLLVPLFIVLALVQVTTWPATVQLQPLLVKAPAGGVMPDGTVTLVVIGPFAGAVPILLTVTGMLAVTPATKLGIVPSMVVKSGAGAAITGAEALAELALLLVTVSFETGVTVAFICGVVPTDEAVGVIGTLNEVVLPLFKGPETVQFTV